MKTSFDVLIIGGGIIGLACAHYLNKAGRSVVLVEQDRIGAGASHGNCGLVFTSHLIPLCAPGVIHRELRRLFRRTSPLYIQPRLNFERLGWLLHFAGRCRRDHLEFAVAAREQILQSSRALYDQLIEEDGLQGDWESRGVLLVYRSEFEMQRYEATQAVLRSYGMEAEAYVGEQLRNFEPALQPSVFGGWYHAHDAHFRPDHLMKSWKTLLLNNGVSIRENCQVIDFEIEKQRIQRIVTPTETLNATEVILANGVWAARLIRRLGLKLPIQPGKGYSLTMARPRNCPKIPCYLSERGVVATPWKSGYRLGGTMEFSGFNTRIVTQRIQQLMAAAASYLIEPLGKPILEEWVGMRPMVFDDLPIIDRLVQPDNMLLATGHGMSGLSMAPSTGKLISELVTGRSPHIDAKPYRLQRFARRITHRKPIP